MFKGEKKGNVSKRIAGIAILLICLILAFIGYKLVRHYNHKNTEVETEKVIDTRLKKYLDSYESTRDITVAVIDSGINMQDDWNDRVISGEYNYTNDDSMTDPFFHGTILSKIIIDDTDEHVKILPIKVADSQGSVDVNCVVNGIQCAIDKHVDIINLSLNMMISDDSKKLEDEILKATDAGIKVIVSAGNNKTDVGNLSPSDMKDVYVVSSIENDNTFSYYSNYGKTVDICAYGTYDRYSGTSYAAAQVSSVFAKLLERDITDIDRVINEYSEAVGTDDEENKEQKYGRGYFGTSMYTASANLNKDDNTNVINLGYNLMSIDWRSMDTDTLDQYLAGTKAEYVGLFLTSLSDSDMKELEEKSYVIHSQVSKQNFERADDESLEFKPTDSQQIDYAEYCINAFNKQKKELNLASTIDAFAVATTNTSEFYISDGDSHLICKYDIDGFYNTIQNDSGQYGRGVVNLRNMSIYGMVVKDDGHSALSIPTIIGGSRIILYATSVQAHEIAWYDQNNNEYTQWHEYHREYIESNSDDGNIYYGLSIDFQNFSYTYGYHTSENDLTVYKAGTNQPAMSYNHVYDINWNYNQSYYGDNCARMPIQTNFKTGTLCKVAINYRDRTDLLNLYHLTDKTSINPSSNEIQLNGPLMYLPGTEWKDGKNWTLAMNNDVAAYVFNTVPNKYTFQYYSKYGTGSVPSDTVNYMGHVKVRNPSYKYAGWKVNHYAVRRQHDDTILCRDNQWHPASEVERLDSFWQPIYPGKEIECNQAWTGSDYNGDDTFTFCAIWKPNNYTFTYNANGGTGKIAPQTVQYLHNLTVSGGFKYEGKLFDGYYVRRQSDHTVYTKAGKWQPESKVVNKNNYSNLFKYYPGRSWPINELWINPKVNGSDSFEFVATWKNDPDYKHNVTYDVSTNGGKWSNGETGTRKVTVIKGRQINLSYEGAVKPGWTFIGWSRNKNANSPEKSLKMASNDITLYAIYKKDISIKFIDCVGTKTINKTLYNNNKSVKIDAPTIAPYSNWKDVSNITTIGYSKIKDIAQDKATESQVSSGQKQLVVSDSCTYYAVYSGDATLSYELNGGTETDSTKPVKKTVYVNASNLDTIRGFELQLAECYKESYQLEGYIHSFLPVTWAENSIDGERYAMNAKYVLTKDTVMYAIWEEGEKEAITYTIHFDGNNGDCVTNVPADIVVKYDQEVNLPEDKPLRTGFKFLDWNTRDSGSGTPYLPGQKVKNLTTINNSVVTLYGHWRQRRLQVVKAASTAYHDTIIRRTMGDDNWFLETGHLMIKQLKNYPDDQCAQVWKIDKSGTIKQIK